MPRMNQFLHRQTAATTRDQCVCSASAIVIDAESDQPSRTVDMFVNQLHANTQHRRCSIFVYYSRLCGSLYCMHFECKSLPGNFALEHDVEIQNLSIFGTFLSISCESVKLYSNRNASIQFDIVACLMVRCFDLLKTPPVQQNRRKSITMIFFGFVDLSVSNKNTLWRK